MITILEYTNESEKSRFRGWFNDLDAKAALKIYTAITRMEQGNFSNTKGVGRGVYEKVIDYGPGYRIYFGDDIKNAIQHWQQYKLMKNRIVGGNSWH